MRTEQVPDRLFERVVTTTNLFLADSAYVLIIMCLAIPARVISVNGDMAKVDFGEGVLREVNITLTDARAGDYVLVHAGYAIQVLGEQEARETLSLWSEILQADAGQS